VLLLLLLLPAAGYSAAAQRFAPLLPGMFTSIAQLPLVQQQGVVKLLAAWRTEGVLPDADIDACEARL